MTGDDATERVEAVERERAEEIAKAHAALAAAQDRSYWLDRWNVDLNALMRRREAGLLRAGMRALRALYRLVYDGRNRTAKAVDTARDRVGAARGKLDREQAQASPSPLPPVAPGRLGATPVSSTLNGRVDAEDPRALAALARADVVVAAFARVGVSPAAGDAWLGIGPGADEVLALLCDANPGLRSLTEDQLAPDVQVDAGFALFGWSSADAARERLAHLHRALRPGGALLLGAERAAGALTPAWLAANATPAWRVALYLPGGLDGDRDLYVLERA